MVPIHEQHKTYLRLQFQNKIYEFQCLPFSLSSASRAFTRFLKPVVAVLRASGIRLVIYLDDILIMHQDRQEIVRIFNMVLALLENLGFLIKREKCSLYPTQALVFLGALLDSRKMTIAVPMQKVQNLQAKSAKALRNRSCSMHQLAAMIGRMNQTSRIGIHQAPLHYRALQRAYIRCLHQWEHHTRSHQAQVPLDSQALEELKWWTSQMISQHNGVALHPPPIDMTIETDASIKGWGAVCKGTKMGGGEVEHQQIQLPYQLPGTESGIPGNSGFCQGRSPNIKAFETVDRQHSHGSVHQQERRYAISTTSGSSKWRFGHTVYHARYGSQQSIFQV